MFGVVERRGPGRRTLKNININIDDDCEDGRSRRNNNEEREPSETAVEYVVLRPHWTTEAIKVAFAISITITLTFSCLLLAFRFGEAKPEVDVLSNCQPGFPPAVAQIEAQIQKQFPTEFPAGPESYFGVKIFKPCVARSDGSP